MNAIEQHLKWSKIKLGVLKFSICLGYDVKMLLYTLCDQLCNIGFGKDNIPFLVLKEVEHYDFIFFVRYYGIVALRYHSYDEDNFKNSLKLRKDISKSKLIDSIFPMLYVENNANVIYFEEITFVLQFYGSRVF